MEIRQEQGVTHAEGVASFRDYLGRRGYDLECRTFLEEPAAISAADNPGIHSWVVWLTDEEAAGIG
jgi:hypothetical protein